MRCRLQFYYLIDGGVSIEAAERLFTSLSNRQGRNSFNRYNFSFSVFTFPGVGQTVEHGGEDGNSNDRCRKLRLTLQDQNQSGNTSSRHNNKESSIAAVLSQKPQEQEETLELSPSTAGTLKVDKVCLREARPDTTESARMLTDEVTQIQEVRYCLRTLREQMAARQNSNNKKYPSNGFKVPSSHPVVTNGNTHVTDNQEESVKLREATKRLHAQLKEMEKRHQQERERLQVEANEYRTLLAAKSEQLQNVEERSEERGQQVEELQKLVGNMKIESDSLKDKMVAREAELLQLKAHMEEEEENAQRCAVLEKEVAALKEKIHHLDDMLKSQQRKVRLMIEQLQNSRTDIEERDRVIRDLEEKVAFLEAENRELHDHMEYFQAGQDLPPLKSTENRPTVVYSKPITPTTPTSKNLPFIKVIEIKS